MDERNEFRLILSMLETIDCRLQLIETKILNPTVSPAEVEMIRSKLADSQTKLSAAVAANTPK